jgi:hypothetical protein
VGCRLQLRRALLDLSLEARVDRADTSISGQSFRRATRALDLQLAATPRVLHSIKGEHGSEQRKCIAHEPHLTRLSQMQLLGEARLDPNLDDPFAAEDLANGSGSRARLRELRSECVGSIVELQLVRLVVTAETLEHLADLEQRDHPANRAPPAFRNIARPRRTWGVHR